MAQSPAHRFGQIIGETLEIAIGPVLEEIAAELSLYLDRKGERKVRGTKRKVAWIDGKGNIHDLDYIFEEGGSAETVGIPRAFIEIAWRRYTKHSRNKAQEIQGAILPLAERYSEHHPFLGVVLGGVFTEGSLKQLRSHGFEVLYFPYDSVIGAFADAGIDACFDEATSDSQLQKKVRAYEKLSKRKRQGIAIHLRKNRQAELADFIESLKNTLTRRISTIYVLPLHGSPRTLERIEEAISYIQEFDESQPRGLFVRFEVGVRYTNRDEVRGQFCTKKKAVAFLRGIT